MCCTKPYTYAGHESRSLTRYSGYEISFGKLKIGQKRNKKSHMVYSAASLSPTSVRLSTPFQL
jgi:hypothetical protein